MADKEMEGMTGDGGGPLISVIVPVYNIMDCLPRCVRSICGQTYKNLEIILVDDGSDDGTERLVDELAEEDGRIRVFHKPNGGSSSARNMGIREAGGEYLGFVDSDDYLSPGMYGKLVDFAGESGLSMVQISRDEIDGEGNRLPDVCTPPSRAVVCPSREFLRELLLHRGDCSFCTKLVRRELFEEESFPEGVLNEDFHLLVRMLARVGEVGILPDQDYHVFYRVGSNTRKKSGEEFSRVFLDIVDNADMVEELVKENYPELKKEAVRFALCQRLDYLLHVPLERMKGSDPFYRRVKRYLRRHLRDTVFSPYLTGRNRLYLLLFTAAPATVRKLHYRLKMRPGVERRA